MKAEALRELADLCEKYTLSFSYSTDDCGISIYFGKYSEEIFLGHMHDEDLLPDELRRAADGLQ
jgi:hypothetical protein